MRTDWRCSELGAMEPAILADRSAKPSVSNDVSLNHNSKTIPDGTENAPQRRLWPHQLRPKNTTFALLAL